jgi:hypothetical protein
MVKVPRGGVGDQQWMEMSAMELEEEIVERRVLTFGEGVGLKEGLEEEGKGLEGVEVGRGEGSGKGGEEERKEEGRAVRWQLWKNLRDFAWEAGIVEMRGNGARSGDGSEEDGEQAIPQSNGPIVSEQCQQKRMVHFLLQ